MESTYKNYTIRRATNLDCAQVKKIVFTSLMEYGLVPQESGKDICLSDLEQNYFNRKGYFLVAIDQPHQEMVGTLGLYHVTDELAEIRKMYIKKEHRGKGLGRFMLEQMSLLAITLNYKKLILETISPLVEAIALYKNFGFYEIPPPVVNDRVDQAFEYVLSVKP